MNVTCKEFFDQFRTVKNFRRIRCTAYLYLCCALALLLAGCVGDDSHGTLDSIWNAEDAIRPRLEMAVGDSASNVIFGGIRDVDVDAHGRIYVADWRNHAIKVISPGGDLLTTIGAEGRGPGDFTGLVSIDLDRDSLFALDSELHRITAFGTDEVREAAYTVQLPRSDTPNAYASRLMKPDTTGFLVEYGTGYPVPPEVGRRQWVGWFTNDGSPIVDSVVAAPARPLLKFRDFTTVLPFGNESFFRLGAEGMTVWAGRNNSLHVKQYLLNGSLAHDIHLPHTPVPIDEEDVEEVLNSAPPPLREKVAQAIQNAGLPDTHPVFNEIVADTRGHLWIDVFDMLEEESIWQVVDQSSQIVGSYIFPENVSLQAVQDEKAYGIRYSESGIREVVVFDLEENPAV